ncbi:MAG: class A beta-lactamase-related serine hydrolase [Candidatus Heimdallarchaeota archaeon]|nr:class A beta-lactamase-related serine hydrolase [Candidatus Heimdallarchaeota archaeon]
MSLAKIVSFENKLKELKEKYILPGMSVAISHENEIVYSKGFGFADREKKIEANPTTPYRIASLTKPISSVIILQMVEKGIIDLDKSIAEYIPNYVSMCEKNKKLLENQIIKENGKIFHLSSLVRGYNYEKQNITIRHHLQQTIINEPGEEYQYNGLLFGLLGIAIDFQAEEKFEGLLRKNIIEELEMKDTLPCHEDTSKPELLDRLAKPYRLNRKRELELSEYPQKNGSSSAGIISTVLDYMKFDKALDENRLIKEETKELAFTNPKNKLGFTLPYGLGFFIQKKPKTEEKLIWHYGYWPGSFSSLYLKIPSKKLSLVIFANSDGLSKGFKLDHGEVTLSPFAKNFLEIF